MKSLNIIPLSKFRSFALKAVKRVSEVGDEVVITTNGKPTAILVSYHDWEEMVETLSIKKDRKLMNSIRAGLKYLRKGGEGIEFEKINWN